MVTYSEIIKAINLKIQQSFLDVPFQSIEDKEGLIRPSFRTNIEGISASNFMNFAKDRELTVRIYYFPKEKYKYRMELLDVQDKLEDLFLLENTIVTESSFVIEIFEFQFDVVDGVLHFYFDLKLSEDINRIDDSEYMEELIYKP